MQMTVFQHGIGKIIEKIVAVITAEMVCGMRLHRSGKTVIIGNMVVVTG